MYKDRDGLQGDNEQSTSRSLGIKKSSVLSRGIDILAIRQHTSRHQLPTKHGEIVVVRNYLDHVMNREG